jgi:hypothetical protein
MFIFVEQMVANYGKIFKKSESSLELDVLELN